MILKNVKGLKSNEDNQLMAIQEKNSDSDDMQTPASENSPTNVSVGLTDSQGDMSEMA
jgi:hypothetical protein